MLNPCLLQLDIHDGSMRLQTARLDQVDYRVLDDIGFTADEWVRAQGGSTGPFLPPALLETVRRLYARLPIGNLLLLLGFFLFGQYLHHVMSIPMSGPLIGMVLLFDFLLARGGPSRSLEDTARSLLASLGLLFVPATIGIIEHLDLIGRHWLPIVVATVAAPPSPCSCRRALSFS